MFVDELAVIVVPSNEPVAFDAETWFGVNTCVPADWVVSYLSVSDTLTSSK